MENGFKSNCRNKLISRWFISVETFASGWGIKLQQQIKTNGLVPLYQFIYPLLERMKFHNQHFVKSPIY